MSAFFNCAKVVVFSTLSMLYPGFLPHFMHGTCVIKRTFFKSHNTGSAKNI